MTTKYKINEQHLDTQHGIHKLTRDGFTRHDIIKAMYQHTSGVSQQDRTKLVQQLYDRRQK